MRQGGQEHPIRNNPEVSEVPLIHEFVLSRVDLYSTHVWGGVLILHRLQFIPSDTIPAIDPTDTDVKHPAPDLCPSLCDAHIKV